MLVKVRVGPNRLVHTAPLPLTLVGGLASLRYRVAACAKSAAHRFKARPIGKLMLATGRLRLPAEGEEPCDESRTRVASEMVSVVLEALQSAEFALAAAKAVNAAAADGQLLLRAPGGGEPRPGPRGGAPTAEGRGEETAEVRVSVVGDSQSGAGVFRQLLSLAAAFEPHLLLHVGDTVQESRVLSEWQEYLYGPLLSQVVIRLGMAAQRKTSPLCK